MRKLTDDQLDATMREKSSFCMITSPADRRVT
jgi:hypothetical protein